MIANLQAKDYKGFTGGKNTYTSLPLTPLEACLDARNVTLSADGVIRKRQGYALVRNELPGAVGRIYDFRRQSDQTQHVYVTGDGQIAVMDPSGAAEPTVLSAAEDGAALWDFADGLAAAYMSNGLKSYRQLNDAGAEKLYQWGLTPPATAPAVSTSPGTLTLQYGRQYVYCPVSLITDSVGVQRMSIGAPSPVSANTGPVTDAVVAVEGIPAAPADPQVTHWWVFCTVDAAFGTSGTYYFAAQIPVGTTSWGDTLTDDELDSTRVAPFDNYPAPAAEILLEYQSRIIACRIAGRPDMVQLSGYSEIDLGLPQEAWPQDLFFVVPGGIQDVAGACVFADRAMIGTQDYWWALSGTDASTFTVADKVAAPGPVGKRAVCVTPTHMVWLSRDKRLWAWDANNAPFELSLMQRKPLAGTLSIQDLNDQTVANAVLLYLDFGEIHWIALLANTSEFSGPGFDWVAVWDLDAQGAPEQQSEVAQAGRAAQFDFLPATKFTTGALVQVSGIYYLFFGDPAGNVYRWPDGYTDAGAPIMAHYATPWHHLGLQSDFWNQGPSALQKRMYWVDVATDRGDAADVFRVSAATDDGMDMAVPATPLDLRPIPRQAGASRTGVRASLNAPGVSLVRWIRFEFDFPVDALPASIFQYSPTFAPVYVGAP